MTPATRLLLALGALAPLAATAALLEREPKAEFG